MYYLSHFQENNCTVYLLCLKLLFFLCSRLHRESQLLLRQPGCSGECCLQGELQGPVQDPPWVQVLHADAGQDLQPEERRRHQIQG